MKILILQGSPRKNGNTYNLSLPFVKRLEELGHSVETLWLYDMDINPCLACRGCQKDYFSIKCVQNDDGNKLFENVMAADIIVIATPIYSWYCTGPAKNVLDRLVYVMNKYYGDEIGPALWAGKKLALIVTCGYRVEQGTDIFEEAIKRYCKHSKLEYLGMLAERHKSYKNAFMDEEKEERAINFANQIAINL